MNEKTNWVINPMKTQFVISIMLYITSLALLLAAMTNFFQEPVDIQSNYVLLFLNISVTIMMVKITRNFFKNQKA